MDKCTELLKKHEGLKLLPYTCTANKLTVGYGRNIEDTGISIEEAEFMLSNDIQAARVDLSIKTSYFDQLDEVRQAVCINMLFNLGWSRYTRFKHMNLALKDHDYTTAAEEMLDSRWAKQVGFRARQLSLMMKSGLWQ